MDEILFITNGADATPAASLVYQFAMQNGKNLTIARFDKPEPIRIAKQQLITNYGSFAENGKRAYRSSLDMFSSSHTDAFQPMVRKVDCSDYNEQELTTFIRRQNYDMVISAPGFNKLNLQTVLNNIDCPMMLLPENLSVTEINRMVYLTDLRYCQQHIMGYLTRFNQSSLLLAHLCEPGLPDLHSSYGDQLFKDTNGRFSKRSDIYFSHVNERNVEKMVDTLIHTMHTDMLVCVNKKFHFQQLTGDRSITSLPAYITVPVLVFPV